MSISSDIPDMKLLILPDHASFIAATPHFQAYVLIPKQKQVLYPVEFSQFLMIVLNTFGGFTTKGEVSGSWLDEAAGVECSDTHTVFAIAIPDDQAAFQFLEVLIARTACALREQSLFVSIAGVRSYFIWASGLADPEQKLQLNPCPPVVH